MARADRFIGKRVVVLGGNSGIGLACAQGFAEEGAGVRLTGRDPQTIASAVASIPGAKGNAVDISDLAAMDAFYETVAAEEGGIDVLMVNAGMGGFSLIEDMTSEYWDQVHSINLRGCVFAMQKAVRLMGEGGAIVVTGSIGGHAFVPGNAAYGAAKAGLALAMRQFAGEYVARGIRVNMVSPGPIETPLLYRNPGMDEAAVEAMREQMIAAVPMKRMGAAKEVADAVLFLASNEASFVTAANLMVDGGALEIG
ncbi:SDR family NAD(P)-dependent oxidoreductase [Novosphingobium decolorationis]|uniref:SDR family oxidoreductase n=1 Tax=Novosphingobium decolorationis TaxID=2698673 RepID=A0ABX8E3T9_9SPHN|nr:SDR family oxidoreductase [Novosphingobium decolorationis]MED5545109.1 SDR family oxidoreductase [Pseudomonadota bacterium]QVM83590.1 SDR family oxidoreductase [Novosphingobium decolorationis]